MPTHVALLRGINLGGHNKVAMAELRELVGSLGHADVATYIQSGNVVFTSDQSDTAALAAGRQSLDQSGLLLLGEVHGVRQNAMLARALMDALDVSGLALEWPAELAAAARDAAARERDTAVTAARHDAERAAAALAAARQAAEQAAQQAARELAALQAAHQAQAGAARALADAAIARAERAEAALDAERAERRALTDKLTAAVPAQPARARARMIPEKQS